MTRKADLDSEENLRTFIYEFNGWFDDLPSQVQWLEMFIASGKMIKGGDESALVFETFFTKLHGLISEAGTFNRYHFLPIEAIEHVNELFPENQFPEEYADMSKAVHLLADRFKKILTLQETEVVEFLRNKSCHMITEGYIASYGKSGHVKMDRNGTLKSEVRERILSSLNNYGGARAFALRCFRDFEKPAVVFSAILKMQIERHAEL